jgi:aspartyl-tRNA(Asn)/glutamyl-tRNA(Gln) amidotransferase subunit A
VTLPTLPDPLGATLALAPDLAAQQAASDARRAAGEPLPLEGWLVGVKANLDMAGLPTHAGLSAEGVPAASADAEAVARLKAAGAIVAAQLNLHEAALGALTDNPWHGRCHNPHRHGFTPGGSSGGSGAAVAAGQVRVALGTDTLGSVRIPASYCGVYGLKPTHGLVPDGGLVALESRWDCIGPLARSVADLGAAMRALAPLGPAEPPRVIGLLAAAERVEMERPVAEAWRLSASLLEGLGCEIRRFEFAFDLGQVRLDGFIRAARALAAAGIPPARMSADLRRMLDWALARPEADVAAGAERLEGVASALRAILGSAEALLLPTTPHAAFPFEGRHPSSAAHFTALASIAGLPALSLPAGWTEAGLPVGVQLVGRAGHEAGLLDLAGRLDRVLQGYRPPQSA